MTDAITAPEHDPYVRALCRHHAAALLAMAAVLLEDVDAAGDIVAATLASACRDKRRAEPASLETRTQLARSVYHRCLGHLAFVERFPQLSGPNDRRRHTAALFGHLSVDQRALLALAVFGGHDVAQIARTLRMPMAVIVDQLPQVLPSVDVVPAGRHDPSRS
jgi:DNA-directed RNA polymerase specialized sigma24 family protein